MRTIPPFPGHARMASVAIAAAAAFGVGSAGTANAADLGNLVTLLQDTADGGWVKANVNTFASVVPDPADRALGYTDSTTVIKAWSGFAGDAKRGDLLLFGGGHGNYSGNEMYIWDGATGMWGRGSLPSQVSYAYYPSGDFIALPVDGAMNAPPSMHTYDNNVYLRVADRFMTLGGPVFNYGGPAAQNPDGSLRPTGPYLYDPAKADPNKVGGTTGSAVDPNVVGGQMWSNRDTNGSLFVLNTWSGPTPLSPVDGTTATAVENGKDVVYTTLRGGPSQYLMKYTINDLSNPALDTLTMVGVTNTQAGAYGAGAFDDEHGLYVGLSEYVEADRAFTVWDTHATNGSGNYNVTLAYDVVGAPAFDGNRIGGIDWSESRGAFLVWTGGGDVWELAAPSSGVITDRWTLRLVTDGDSFAAGMKPDGMDPSGVRGKWKYVDNLDAFVALEGNSSGDVWLYRPLGWVAPAVPEPASALLLLGGGAMLIASRRRHPARKATA